MSEHRIFHTPGAFGNYVAFLLDCKTKGKIGENPFTESGSSHAREVITQSCDIVLSDEYEIFLQCTKDDIGIYWPNEYFFYILHSAYGRTNHGQYGKCGVRALQENTWQWLSLHTGHNILGNDLELFVSDLEKMYNFKLDEKNQKVPINLLRHYFFFHFIKFFNNKLYKKNKEIYNNNIVKKLDIETIFDYDKLKKFLDIGFDFENTHNQFIEKNSSLIAYNTQKQILSSVKNEQECKINDLDIITQAGVLYELEKHFYDIPFYNLDFNFKNTSQILDYVKQFPNYMRKPNNLFLEHWRIYNDK